MYIVSAVTLQWKKLFFSLQVLQTEKVSIDCVQNHHCSESILQPPQDFPLLFVSANVRQGLNCRDLGNAAELNNWLNKHKPQALKPGGLTLGQREHSEEQGPSGGSWQRNTTEAEKVFSFPAECPRCTREIKPLLYYFNSQV